MNSYDENWYKQYDRIKGSRKAKGPKKRTITFSWEKFLTNQGQTTKEWENEGLLSEFCEMMRQISQYDTAQALALQMIKQYTKVGFPPDSGFKEPKHVSPQFWAVIHIKPNSKAVVVGYIEIDVFYIVFLDKEHLFWSSDIQKRGKTTR